MLQYNLTNFDEQLKQMSGLKWLPWIGQFYEKTKTIILGESQYEDEDDWQDDNINATRFLIGTGFSEKKWGKPYYNAEKVLLSIDKPTKEQGSFLWKSVVYWNLVQRLMSSRKERPNNADFYNGWKLFFAIIDTLQPKPTTCIVLGKSSFGQLGCFLNNYDTSWNRNVSEFYKAEKIINLSRREQNLKLIFINHPSGSFGFKYKYWAQLVSDEEPSLQQLLSEMK